LAPKACEDPGCSIDHGYGGHDYNGHDHSHGHSHGEGGCEHSGCEHSSSAAAPAAAAPTTSAPPAVAAADTASVLLVDAGESSLTLAWHPVAKAIKYELEWRPAAAKGAEEVRVRTTST